MRKNGKIIDYSYDIFEEPFEAQAAGDSPLTEKPLTEKQSAEKQIQPSTNKINTKLQKADYRISKVAKSTYGHDDQPYKCAIYLDMQISLRLPDRPVTTEVKLQKWSVDINKINSNDGYNWSLIHDVLKFSQQDDFWRDNILSGEDFRKHFEKLYARFSESQNEDNWYLDFK